MAANPPGKPEWNCSALVVSGMTGDPDCSAPSGVGREAAEATRSGLRWSWLGKAAARNPGVACVGFLVVPRLGEAAPAQFAGRGGAGPHLRKLGVG